jgi:ComF family protein
MRAGWEAAVGLLFPPVCQLCGEERAGPQEGYVCGRCWSRPGGIRLVVPPYCGRCGLPFEGDITAPFECANCRDLDLAFSSARAAVVATPFLLEIIHRYKYQRALWFEPFLADLLIRQAAAPLREGSWDALVPVPLFPVKRREREFNQAERLGAALAQAAGLPLVTHAVRRVVPTRTQTRLNRQERADNMRGAFAPAPGRPLAGKRVVLVDDVLTTGATTNACALALRAAGAAEVSVWTLARGL